MFRKAVLLVLVFCLFSSSILLAKEIGGIEMPEKIDFEEETLLLNGAGIREKFFINLYVCGLYLKQKNSSARKIIDANQTMAVRLHIVSGLITSERMEEATIEGFRKSTDGDLSGIKERMNKFVKVFKDREIQEGDVFELVYKPKKGVRSYKNGKLLDTTKGLDFKKALFGIWLSDNPVQANLKRDMLDK